MKAKGERAAMVPLAVLLRRETSSEKMETPDVLYGQASQSKRGEDLTPIETALRRDPGDCDATYSVFALFDGHNSYGAAVYAREKLLDNILGVVPSYLNRQDCKWLATLPRALVAGFVKTDKDFQISVHSSGTTVTFVIIDGWVATVASVGDSRCILESAEGSVYYLSADHRLEVNAEEVDRIVASGGEVGRLSIVGGTEYHLLFHISPLRCWSGGLCLSRSIGDMDVGEFIVPVPYVKQVKLIRQITEIEPIGKWVLLLLISWFHDCCSSQLLEVDLSSQVMASGMFGLPASIAAHQIVKVFSDLRILKLRHKHILVHCSPSNCKRYYLHCDRYITSRENNSYYAPAKKQGMCVFKHLFWRMSPELSSNFDRNFVEPDVWRKYSKENLHCYSKGKCRLSVAYPIHNLFKLFVCAICQIKMKPYKGYSVNGNSHQSRKPWDGPFICPSCQQKKEAMEGRRPSRGSSFRKSSGSE
ncbi:probable protein phosphatase 2C 12 [Zingiber officinale]|uniref:probable protein phosphatase 2C 12 n=1 Tax=Zingiber officinale TaxID=94328 RepID=UPI001C4D27CA|nr:probable protein phosphatase 2C 12 [Zingiber officinale]